MEEVEIGMIGGMALLGMFLYGMAEMLWLSVLSKKVSFRHDYSQVFSNLLFVNFITIALPILSTAGFAILGAKLAPLSFSESWYIWPAAFLIYEFWYWVQHFLAHKVRLLWCLHSAHHAPDTMNMVVGYNHNIMEVPYMSFFMGFMPAICGVPLEMIVLINSVDVVWGSMLHISPRVVKKRYGPLEYFLQTPSYHSVHHARNPRYMDTNYNSMSLFWDWALGTLQPLKDEEPVDYGITRPVNVESWRDVQFGEVALLWKDIAAAPGIKNKLSYLLMPPGWSHTGDHKMASSVKQALA